MARTHIDKRSLLVSAAVDLAYQNGFGANLACRHRARSRGSSGNVYYYFKTKDEIGEAIVELRLAQLSAQRQRWNEAGSPKDSALRLRPRCPSRTRISWRSTAAAVGTFLLRAPQGARARSPPERPRSSLDTWPGSRASSVALGKGKDSKGLAVHLLSALQGVSILAHSFHDSDLVATETKRLKSWIQSL